MDWLKKSTLNFEGQLYEQELRDICPVHLRISTKAESNGGCGIGFCLTVNCFVDY